MSEFLEIPLDVEVESLVIHAKTRTLDEKWSYEVQYGIEVKNQNFKVGDIIEDMEGHVYGVVFEKHSDRAIAKHALLQKQDRGWVITTVAFFDLLCPMMFES